MSLVSKRRRRARRFAEANQYPWRRGPVPALMSALMFRDYAAKLLDEYRERGLVSEPGRGIVASYTVGTNRITAKITVTWEVVARMVWDKYEGGESHAAVTAWLEEQTPGFRDYLTESEIEPGAKRWLLIVRELPGYTFAGVM